MRARLFFLEHSRATIVRAQPTPLRHVGCAGTELSRWSCGLLVSANGTMMTNARHSGRRSYRRHYPLVRLGNSPHNDIIKEALMPTVSISFLNLRDEHGNIRTFAYKDSPEWSETGTCDDFRHHEVLELLA